MAGGNQAGDPGTEPGRAGSGARDRAVRNRAVRWAAVLLSLVTAAGTAACAGPPSKGEVHGAPLNQSRNNVVILAREPSPDMPPELLVANFLQALTGDQKDPTFSVAQEYLTPDARAKWIPAGSTLVTTTKIVASYRGPVVDADPAAVTRPAHPGDAPSATPGAATSTAWVAGEVKTVSVSGTQVAQIDENGFFKYLSQPVKQTFSVKYLGPGTGWRIAVKPDFRMVTPEAFKRAYQTYQGPLPVYLPLRGSVSPHMDQVYLTQAPGKVDDTYSALAQAVLHGRYPWQDSHLTLQSVTVDAAGLATVKLQVPAGGTPNFSDVQRALFQTFLDASETPQLLSPTPLTAVKVTYDGCTTPTCAPVEVQPENAAAPNAYWVCPQNGTDSAIVSRQASGTSGLPPVCPANGGKAQSVVGLTGIRLAKNTPIAVKQSPDPTDFKASAATTAVAAVEEDGNVVVLNDKNTDRKTWYTAADASKVTDLEWDPVDGALWVVDDNNLYRVQEPGPGGPSSATQESVAVPGLEVTRFKPSPDGLRAVVVSPQTTSNPGTASSPQPASMVTIDRAGGVPTLSTDTVFQLLAGTVQTADQYSPALQSVTDAAWADGRTVVLLGVQTGSSTAKLYKVYVDGSQDSTIAEPDDAQLGATHIAAAISVTNGHTSLWTISEAPGPANPSIAYFKRSGGSDSFQEIGSSPVIVTVVPS